MSMYLGSKSRTLPVPWLHAPSCYQVRQGECATPLEAHGVNPLSRNTGVIIHRDLVHGE